MKTQDELTELKIKHYEYKVRTYLHSYERFLLYEFVEPVLNYRSNEFVALTNLSETGPCTTTAYFVEGRSKCKIRT